MVQAVRTSDRTWLRTLAKAYKAKMAVTLVDDAGLGVDPLKDTLLQMGQKANLRAQEWVAVGIGLGVSAVGAYLLVMAVIDPEPFSKIGLAIGAGATLTMGGGLAAMQVLTKQKPPTVRLSPLGHFEIEF